MARKASSTTRRASSKKAAVAAVALSVASIVGYDPCLLLPAPAAAHEVLVEAPAEGAHLASMALEFDVDSLSPPAAIEVLAEEAAIEAEAPVDAIGAFKALSVDIKPFEVGNASLSVGARFTSRAAYEADKNPENDNIHRTLRKCRQALTHDANLRVLLACGVDEGFIDHGMREGARYNVYAIDKVQDLVAFLAGNPSLNRINSAVLRTMIEFERAGRMFTMDIAKAAASDKIRVDPALRPLMRSHTVSASTAPTQASSTMQALMTLGIVWSSGKGGSKNPSYAFTDSPQALAIKARLA